MTGIIRNKPAELTRAELEIMRIVWEKQRVFVHDILAAMEEPRPAYNTVSTIVRILEKKGFLAHEAYGKTHEYYPLVEKEAYARRYMAGVLDHFFDGSVSRMISFFSQNRSITLEETDEILRILRGENDNAPKV